MKGVVVDIVNIKQLVEDFALIPSEGMSIEDFFRGRV